MEFLYVEDVRAYCDPGRASVALANALREGCVGLFLGAGVSIDAGLPGWGELTERCVVEARIPRDQIEEALAQKDYYAVIAEIDKPPAATYIEIVRRALYPSDFHYNSEFARSRLLVALGSLISGGGRGRVSPVITLNFDDLLEWYLGLHGLPTQAVTRLPAVIRAEGTTVYHPHGFLPHPASQHETSDFLLFSRRSVDERIAEGNNSPWWRLMRDTLFAKVGLFVGMSDKTATDYVLSPILSEVAKATRDRIVGFWVFGYKIPPGVRQHLLGYRVVPLEFGSHEEAADFLLSVCTIAGAPLQRVD